MRDNVNVECFHYFFTPHARLSCYATVKEFGGLYFIRSSNFYNFTLNTRVHNIKITLVCSFVLLTISSFLAPCFQYNISWLSADVSWCHTDPNWKIVSRTGCMQGNTCSENRISVMKTGFPVQEMGLQCTCQSILDMAISELKYYSPTVTHDKIFVYDFCFLWIIA